jgi:glycine/D-amino acid oxidase-like deaminating enzyme
VISAGACVHLQQKKHMYQTGVLIIGGGIAGTACYLDQSGRQVTVLEQGELAMEASGLNAGTLWADSIGALESHLYWRNHPCTTSIHRSNSLTSGAGLGRLDALYTRPASPHRQVSPAGKSLRTHRPQLLWLRKGSQADRADEGMAGIIDFSSKNA